MPDPTTGSPLDFEQAMAETLMINSHCLEKAAEAYNAEQADIAALQKKAGPIVDLSVRCGVLPTEDRADLHTYLSTATREKLASFVEAVLEKFAESVDRGEAAFPGRPVNASGQAATKQASARQPLRVVGGGAGKDAANAAFDESLYS